MMCTCCPKGLITRCWQFLKPFLISNRKATCSTDTDVQLYCKRNDDIASDVCQDLIARLGQQRIKLTEINSTQLESTKPTLLVSFRTSRPLADVSEATRDIKHRFSGKMVLIICHLTSEDNVTDGSSELIKGYEDFFSIGLLVDIGFRNNKGRFCLNGNSHELNEIVQFLAKKYNLDENSASNTL